MKVIVDRFEEQFAVVELENGELVNIPKVLVQEAEEGDIIEIIINKKETEKQGNYIKNLVDNLFED